MKPMFIAALAAVLLVCSCDKSSKQEHKAPVSEVVLTKCPFTRGVNLGDWFMGKSPSEVNRTTYTAREFANLRSLGIDVVRVPVRFNYFVGAAPDYKIDSHVLDVLDYAVDMAEGNGMYIIIDNHAWLSEDFPSLSGPVIMEKVFTQLAERYKDRSDKVIYELFNEPGGDFIKSHWYDIQTELIGAIRRIDTRHSIIVTGVGCSIDNLRKIPVYEDRNLIYTFHYYGPHLFTHQGASWEAGMTDFEKPVPFPYDADRMPALPNTVTYNVVIDDYNDYASRGTAAYISHKISSTAGAFAEERGVPVFCGEWGVLNGFAEPADRAAWAKATRDALDASNIGWTWWSYRNDFSIFRKDASYFFEQNLDTDLLAALGFTVPDWYNSDKPVDITVYDDALAPFCNACGPEGDSDWKSADSPYSGTECISWTVGKNAWRALEAVAWPPLDISRQASADYSLTFAIRSSEPVDKLLVRAVTYNPQGDRIPWRFGAWIGNELSDEVKIKATFPSDGKWHYMKIPLSRFSALGAMDSDGWHAPTDEPCDWAHFNVLQFAVEGNSALVGKRIDVDDIIIKYDTIDEDPSPGPVGPVKPGKFVLFDGGLQNSLSLEKEGNTERLSTDDGLIEWTVPQCGSWASMRFNNASWSVYDLSSQAESGYSVTFRMKGEDSSSLELENLNLSFMGKGGNCDVTGLGKYSATDGEWTLISVPMADFGYDGWKSVQIFKIQYTKALTPKKLWIDGVIVKNDEKVNE